MVQITREDSDTKGRYVASVNDFDDKGELTFSKLGENTVIADHTGVPDSLRGQGVGKALVERLVADAREHGFKIVPLCPFVKAQFGRHPEWADVLDG